MIALCFFAIAFLFFLAGMERVKMLEKNATQIINGDRSHTPEYRGQLLNEAVGYCVGVIYIKFFRDIYFIFSCVTWILCHTQCAGEKIIIDLSCVTWVLTGKHL